MKRTRFAQALAPVITEDGFNFALNEDQTKALKDFVNAAVRSEELQSYEEMEEAGDSVNKYFDTTKWEADAEEVTIDLFSLYDMLEDYESQITNLQGLLAIFALLLSGIAEDLPDNLQETIKPKIFS